MWWNGYSGMMMGHGWGWMPFGGLLFLLLLALVIVGLVALVCSVLARGASDRAHPPGLDILEERYARGEIQRDEYLQKKRDLGG